MPVSSRTLAVVPALVLILAGAAACSRETPADPPHEPPPPDYAATVQAWRDKHESDYRRDFVTITGLHTLEPGTHTVGAANTNAIVLQANVPASIGRLIVADGAVTYEPAPGIAATQRGETLTGPAMLKAKDQPPAPEVVIGSVRFVIHTGGGRLALRVRDPDSAQARSFAGYAWFPIDPSVRVVGRLIRDPAPPLLKVANTFGDFDEYTSEGIVEFVLGGERLRLRPFTTRPKRFYFVFRDASAGEETYKVARFLYADLRDDGTTILDFNQAYNPPCAFNPYTTCPLPLRENVLGVKVLAGERGYAGK